MKISVRGEYALRALIVLGLSPEREDVVRTQEISKRQNIPKRFLEQILSDLKAGGIVESKRGILGGYRLRRTAEEVTLAEIIRHIEGPLAPIGRVGGVAADFTPQCANQPGKRKRLLPRFGIGCRQLIDDGADDDERGDDE